MIWFNVNFVMNGTISVVLISKLEIKHLVYGSVNIVINMDPDCHRIKFAISIHNEGIFLKSCVKLTGNPFSLNGLSAIHL